MITEIVKLLFLVCVLCFNGVCFGGEDLKILNVLDFGTKADGKTDDARSFQDTWTAACSNTGPVLILIPQGTYLLGPVKFSGPCKNVPSITMKIDGYLRAETDLNKYPSGDWIYFGSIDGLTISGTGTFDGQGAAIWHDCLNNEKCKLLPTNFKFMSMKNTVISGITSLNSKNFHFGVVECKNFKASGIKIIAPGDSPNTDGIHLERCSDITIQDTRIATGNDCISFGQDLSNVFISGVGCGPGHGISVGSLGKFPEEKEVRGIVVKNTTIIGTLNGVRIKSRQYSPSPSAVSISNITFENIIMNSVNNPITIDQFYCPTGSCPNKVPAQVRISDVSFKNIRGTYTSGVGVMLHCSQGFPCQNVQLQEINLQYKGAKSPPRSICLNVKPQYTGTQLPEPCAS